MNNFDPGSPHLNTIRSYGAHKLSPEAPKPIRSHHSQGGYSLLAGKENPPDSRHAPSSQRVLREGKCARTAARLVNTRKNVLDSSRRAAFRKGDHGYLKHGGGRSVS